MMEVAGLRRANVLAVDDQRANLITLDAVLGAEFNLILASSGPEAISILESRHDVDVILMDAQMPVMDGFETASRIKKMEGCQDIPIVFITAIYNEDPFIKQGYKVGAVDYFSKPFDPEILKVKVGIYASFRQRADVLKERARQIRESEELLRAGRRLSAVLERLQPGVIVTDISGRICHVNPEVLDLRETLGWWTPDGQLNRGLPDPLARALTQGETSPVARLEIQHAGMARSILCSASPLRDLEGRVVGAVLVVNDATERNQVERDLARRISHLASAGAEFETG